MTSTSYTLEQIGSTANREYRVLFDGRTIGRVAYSSFYGRWEAIHGHTRKPGQCDLHPSPEQAAEAVVREGGSVTTEEQRLKDAAEKAQAQADRAFKRWCFGEVKSASAAARLQNKADDAWVELTSRYPQKDFGR